MFDKIKKSDKLVKLLQALAFQMGSEVSYNELSQTCGLDPKTVESRLDAGALFENYMVSERLKKLRYEKSYAQSYFWRSKTKQEIDYVEDMDGQLSAVEFKWNPKRKASMPLSFSRSYSDVEFKVVTRDNYESFLL